MHRTPQLLHPHSEHDPPQLQLEQEQGAIMNNSQFAGFAAGLGMQRWY